MSQLFERAKQIGIANIKSIIRDGRQEGREWVALNPTRADKNCGSFRVNLDTGAWADFADGDARGNDVVSLYAYLHKDILSGKATKYKNHQGGLQAEAAKEILVSYDPTYFPDTKDNFLPRDNQKSNYWDGFRWVEKGLKDPPDLDTNWHQKQWGTEKDRWYFTVDKKTIMVVVRFIGKDGKKNDRPFTLWTDGNETRWRTKAPKSKYPLWNVDELSERQNDPVLLTEGQKSASVVKPVATQYVCIGWYGGANAPSKTNWEPLRGREVWFPFDADFPGRKALSKIKEIAQECDIKLHPVYPPPGVDKGWDIADSIEDGWGEDEVYTFIDNGEAENGSEFLDEENLGFRILGYSADHIVFYSYASKLITRHKASTLSKGVLLSLMDREEWAKYFVRAEGGVDWGSAINYVIRTAERKPVFDPSLVRGAGAWIDNSKVVINTGSHLLIAGKKRELHESEGEFVYEKARSVPYRADNLLPTEDAANLISLLKLISWKHISFPYILAGWCLLAPFGGAIRWRPHVWITGRKGSGKSWILENIIYLLVANNYGVKGYGTSTPAGIRQKLGNSALASTMDEMEADNPKYAEYIDQNLKMFREGSSGTGRGAATLHGTSDGEGREWLVQSMALFASIGAGIKHGADRSRFTLLTIGGGDKSEDISEQQRKFKELERQTEIFTGEWVQAFHARTYVCFEEVRKCIQVMGDQATEILNNRRDADQVGTLLAGAWMIEHERSATAAEAKQFLENLDIGYICQDIESKTDEELCLDEIMSSRIEITRDDRPTRTTMGACLSSWYKAETTDAQYDPDMVNKNKSIKRELEQYGIKPVNRKDNHVLQIAIGHPALKKILKDTPWRETYDVMLSRLDFCYEEIKGPGRFAGIQKRFRELDMREVFDAVPF